MKKGRPGTLLSVIARVEDQATMETLLFQHTPTLGIRIRKQVRRVLPRTLIQVQTPWGLVPGKVSKLPTGDIDFSPEYDACRTIALAEGLRWIDVVDESRQCYWAQESDQADAEQTPNNEAVDDQTSPRYRWDSSPWPGE